MKITLESAKLLGILITVVIIGVMNLIFACIPILLAYYLLRYLGAF
jgi:type IV secretory pathway VirB3-like protein